MNSAESDIQKKGGEKFGGGVRLFRESRNKIIMKEIINYQSSESKLFNVSEGGDGCLDILEIG